MKTFTQFLEEQKQKQHKNNYLPFETCFGHVEKADSDLQEQVSTTPGKIKANEQIGIHSNEEAKKIHGENEVKSHPRIIHYTGSGASYINRGLHHEYRQSLGVTNSSTSHEHHKLYDPDKKDIKLIDAHLDKHTIKKDIHVFTGLPHSPVHAFRQQNAKKGESIKVHLPAYTSTSTDYKTAYKFAKYDENDTEHHSPINTDAPKKIENKEKHILKLHVPAGTKGGSVRDQSALSNENEVLLHRGHNIEIHPHPTVNKDGTHVWHARIISHTPSKID